MKSKKVSVKSTRNYGMLTDASKALNKAFGDETGRTVSMRSAHGFKNTFNLPHMDDNTAEDIMHAGMIGAGGLLSSRNDGAKAVGVLLLAALVCCYRNG